MQSYILLDRSGSMGSRWTEALSSINAYVKGLKDVGGDYNVTVATFDSNTEWTNPTIDINTPTLQPQTTQFGGTPRVSHAPTPRKVSTFDIIRNAVPVADFNDLSQTEILPRGGTPLYDATAKLVNLVRSQNPDRAVLVIMTDGEENASTEIRDASIAKKMLDECRERNWQVIFLGADFDNVKQAATLGTQYANSIRTKGGAGLRNAMHETSAMASNYFSAGTAMNYSDSSRLRAVSDTFEDIPPIISPKLAKTMKKNVDKSKDAV